MQKGKRLEKWLNSLCARLLNQSALSLDAQAFNRNYQVVGAIYM